MARDSRKTASVNALLEGISQAQDDHRTRGGKTWTWRFPEVQSPGQDIWRANQDLLARSDHISVPVSRKATV